jgi:hypothetical protein
MAENRANLDPTEVLQSLVAIADSKKIERDAIAPRGDALGLTITALSKLYNKAVDNRPAIVPEATLNNRAASYMLLQEVAHAEIVPPKPGSVAAQLIDRLTENTAHGYEGGIINDAVLEAGFYDLERDVKRQGFEPLGLTEAQLTQLNNIQEKVEGQTVADDKAWAEKQKQGIAADIGGLGLTSDAGGSPAAPKATFATSVPFKLGG